MYTTTRNLAAGTFMTCKDCGHAVSMNKMCEKPLQTASDILKHMAAHNASHGIAVEGHVPSELVVAHPLSGSTTMSPQKRERYPHWLRDTGVEHPSDERIDRTRERSPLPDRHS
jgi:hypothetical protein